MTLIYFALNLIMLVSLYLIFLIVLTMHKVYLNKSRGRGNGVNARAQAQVQVLVQAHFQALVEALVLSDGFDDFYEGPFDSCFGHLHEVCYSLLD